MSNKRHQQRFYWFNIIITDSKRQSLAKPFFLFFHAPTEAEENSGLNKHLIWPNKSMQGIGPSASKRKKWLSKNFIVYFTILFARVEENDVKENHRPCNDGMMGLRRRPTTVLPIRTNSGARARMVKKKKPKTNKRKKSTVFSSSFCVYVSLRAKFIYTAYDAWVQFVL